jgi:guanine deaminase
MTRTSLKGHSMATQKFNFYIATILNPQDDKTCDFYPHGLLVTETSGKEAVIKDVMALEAGVKKYHKLMKKKNTTDFGHSLIMPGFFDMHFHWVQDDVREMPKDSLLGWLQKYTFPTEMKFKNKIYAKKRAKVFFQKLLEHGTLGGACYSSIHEHAVDTAIKKAQGHFVIGNVLMNMNSPEELTQSEEDSLELTKRLIKKHGTKHCFTPRFAITTTPKVMKEGSKLADKAKCFKQTHLSETPQEIDFVLSIYKKFPGFEKVKSYTEIYQKTGMLGERSLMGHGIHLLPKELEILKKTKTAVIHCPTSNAPLKEKGLGSGLFDLKKIEKSKIRWALGSDIGGGPFLSMFDVMRSFVDQHNKSGRKDATYIKALYRATLAGAEILGLGKSAGNLNKGKEASFIVVPMAKKSLPQDAEAALKELVEPHKKKRQKYADLVQSVYYRGQTV